MFIVIYSSTQPLLVRDHRFINNNKTPILLCWIVRNYLHNCYIFFKALHCGAVASTVAGYIHGSHQAQLSHSKDPSMPPHRVLDTRYHRIVQEPNQGSGQCN